MCDTALLVQIDTQVPLVTALKITSQDNSVWGLATATTGLLTDPKYRSANRFSAPISLPVGTSAELGSIDDAPNISGICHPEGD
jgi:hypothetical protein